MGAGGWLDLIRHPVYCLKAARARRLAWRRLFPENRPRASRDLAEFVRQEAAGAAAIILRAHRGYLAEFDAITAQARETFESRDWGRGARNADHRAGIYRTALDRTWRDVQRQFGDRALDREFWLAAREIYLERVFRDYDSDLALSFFYSTMRIAFGAKDVPVEYDDDGLAARSHVWNPRPVWDVYSASERELPQSIRTLLARQGFRTPLAGIENAAEVAAERLLRAWQREIDDGKARDPHPRQLQMLKPVFFRDQEAYLAGKLRASHGELPVVFALRNDDRGITLDAVLTGKEDMRNILFISTRSTFHVRTDEYREVLAFLDTLAPERGHPAMCAVLGFTHPARVALNQALRRHLRETGERFAQVPGRTGMAMVVFAPPGFPYVFKVIRDHSPKPGWTGRGRVMDLYRWVHEMNRGRLMLDAWMYRNLHFPRRLFEDNIARELLRSAPHSVLLDGDTLVLRHVYAQRRVRPLNTFFDEVRDGALRVRAVDALGTFIKDLAAMGFFMGDCYGLPFNTGLTHGFNVALFDFDDLGPLERYRFRETPPPPGEQDELLWNSEVDGAWFSMAENDVLVDEWERFLGVPPELREYFRQRHGSLFTTEYWRDVQRRVAGGELHYVLPYPAERRLARSPLSEPRP